MRLVFPTPESPTMPTFTARGVRGGCASGELGPLGAKERVHACRAAFVGARRTHRLRCLASLPYRPQCQAQMALLVLGCWAHRLLAPAGQAVLAAPFCCLFRLPVSHPTGRKQHMFCRPGLSFHVPSSHISIQHLFLYKFGLSITRFAKSATRIHFRQCARTLLRDIGILVL